jgi:two-component system response regulator
MDERIILLAEGKPRDEALTLRALAMSDLGSRMAVVPTASDDGQDGPDGYRVGANSYIRKPVDYLQFAKAIRQFGLYWLALNEPPPNVGA